MILFCCNRWENGQKGVLNSLCGLLRLTYDSCYIIGTEGKIWDIQFSFLLFWKCLFILRERENIPSRRFDVGLYLMNREITTLAGIKSWMLNRRSHPGAPWVNKIHLFYRWGNWGLEELCYLLDLTKLLDLRSFLGHYTGHEVAYTSCPSLRTLHPGNAIGHIWR